MRRNFHHGRDQRVSEFGNQEKKKKKKGGGAGSKSVRKGKTKPKTRCDENK